MSGVEKAVDDMVREIEQHRFATPAVSREETIEFYEGIVERLEEALFVLRAEQKESERR